MPPPASRPFGSIGISQASRWPLALHPAHAPLDDRSEHELLDQGLRFGSLVHFYGSDHQIAGDWVELLASDPYLALASIAATDTRRIERRLSALEHEVRWAPDLTGKRAALVTLWDTVLDLPRHVDRWHRGLSVATSNDVARQWRARLDEAIEHDLRTVVQQLKACDLGAARSDTLGEALGLDYTAFSSRWALDGVGPDASLYSGASEAERIDRLLPHVLPVWRRVGQRVAGWAADARTQLTRGLELDRNGSTAPHVALLVAFARLFATAQHSINALGGRRTDFYYRQILKEHHRPGMADAVHVGFQHAPAREPVAVVVPAGTALAGGKDAAGRDLVYESQHAITVTPAALSQIMTLRVTAAPVTPRDTGSVRPQRVLARTLPPWTWDQPAWATFGAASDAPAELGFAVRSSTLRLSGGERTIRLDIRHAPHDPGTDGVLRRIGLATGLTPAAVLDQVLARAFALSVSTPDGWLDVDRYDVLHDPDRRHASFSLRFALGSQAPPLAGFDRAPAGRDRPVVRAHPRQEPVVVAGATDSISLFPLSVLCDLRITDVRVQATVAALPNLRVFNADGQVDPSTPFPAFGAFPAAGTALRVKHDELFEKQIDRLAIRITWFDLPLNRTGFRGYYRHYVVDPDGVIRERLFDNRSFRATVTVEHPGAWDVAEPSDEAERYLFRTKGSPDAIPEPDDPLSPIAAFDPITTAALTMPSGYRPSDGALRIELRSPAYAFGATLFAPNTLHAMLTDMPGGTGDAACRAAYAPLADARTRLTDLLGGGGFRRSDAMLHAISPAPWPRRAERRLRAAYRDIADAWRAYLTSRPGRDEPAAWIVRNQDGTLDETDTSPTGDGGYRRRIQAALLATMRSLLEAATACLAESMASAQDRLEDGEWQAWQRHLTDASRGDATQQLSALRALHGQLVGTTSGREGRTAALRKCDALLRAASMVHDCDAHADHLNHRYVASVRANIRKCVTLLQSLYDISVQQCRDDRASAARPMPNPPYQPRIEALAIDYIASGPAEFIHLLPFGGFRSQPVSAAAPPALVPQFANAGNLLLGLTGLVTPQTLRVFVKMGPGDARLDRGPQVVWEYLAEDGWVRLEAPHAEADETHGLRRSGTLALAFPATTSEGHTILPAGRHWLRAAVVDQADAFPETIGLLLHAVTAVRRVAEETDDLDRPLPPQTIRGPVRPIKGIAGVLQPGPSFGGRAPESDRAFQTRVSERLRHRGRAVAGWDHERLVLERFPMLWAARTLAARRLSRDEASPAGPGHVIVVVVPGPACAEATDPTAPLASRDRLAAIEASLADVAAPGVTIQACNPVYVRLRVSASVQWTDGTDPHASARELDRALVEYLSPWTADDGKSSRSENEIRQFIRARPDVVSLASFSIEYDPARPAIPELCLITSAASHEIRSAAFARIAAVKGY